MKENKKIVNQTKIEKVLFSNEKILDGIKKLAEKMNDYFTNSSKSIVFVGILKGCLPFMMELIKHINFDPIMDFMIVSSYSGGTKKKFLSPKLVLDIDTDVSGKNVVIIEDIMETGKTVELVTKNLKDRGSSNVYTASLLLKKRSKTKNFFIPNWYVFKAPEKFLVGFGLDYGERMRNLPYIGVLKSFLYEK